MIYAEEIEINQGKIRDIVTMTDGRIALLFDWFSAAFLTPSQEYCGENPNTVYRSDHVYMLHCDGESAEARRTAKRPRIASAPSTRPRHVDSADNSPVASDGAELYRSRCARCHTTRTRNHDVGPHLVGVVGRPAGTVGGYNFSTSFTMLNQIWTTESLVRFLSDPSAFAPDTRMPDTGISEAQARAIIEHLLSWN